MLFTLWTIVTEHRKESYFCLLPFTAVFQILNKTPFQLSIYNNRCIHIIPCGIVSVIFSSISSSNLSITRRTIALSRLYFVMQVPRVYSNYCFNKIMRVFKKEKKKVSLKLLFWWMLKMFIKLSFFVLNQWVDLQLQFSILVSIAFYLSSFQVLILASFF